SKPAHHSQNRRPVVPARCAATTRPSDAVRLFCLRRPCRVSIIECALLKEASRYEECPHHGQRIRKWVEAGDTAPLAAGKTPSPAGKSSVEPQDARPDFGRQWARPNLPVRSAG